MRLFLLLFTLLAWFMPIALGEENELDNEIPRLSTGSCAKQNLCCPGRDSSCVVQKAAPNSIIEDLSDVPCFCDYSCVNLGDCCSDFKRFCGVQDCKLSNWGPWSECDNDCGPGVMTRTRSVIYEARNGGTSCPPLVQKRGCRGSNCQKETHRFNTEDTAIILPVEYGMKRKMNQSSDITKNLRLRYPKNPATANLKNYCVEFEIVHRTRSCNFFESFATLNPGTNVCVMCEREAQRSHLGYKCAGSGSHSDKMLTRFSSLREPSCRGKWRQLRSDLECTCAEGARFIFV